MSRLGLAIRTLGFFLTACAAAGGPNVESAPVRHPCRLLVTAAMHSTFFTSDSAYLGGAFLAGTSFAAPHVTGALALALTKYPNEPHTRTISRVLVATEPLPALAGRCRTGGRLNLSRILNPPIELAIVNAGGGRRIEGRTSPGRVCVIEASENLSSWSAIGARVSSEDGRFQFLDFGPGVQTRFYRAAASP